MKKKPIEEILFPVFEDEIQSEMFEDVTYEFVKGHMIIKAGKSGTLAIDMTRATKLICEMIEILEYKKALWGMKNGV